MRACAWGECSTFRWSMPGSSVSIVYSARPVTTSAPAGAPTLVPTARPGAASFDRGYAIDRILDRPIAGAAAQVTFQRVRQVLLLFIGQSGRRHDHAGGAEAALESGGVAKLPLHRVQVLGRTEPLDCGHRMPVGAERRRDAAVHGTTVEPDRARAAITGVATLFDAVPAQVTQERPQALTRSRFLGERLAVDGVAHRRPPSSIRISSA